MKNTTGPNPLSDARPGRREIRSFVLREGRLTKAQARALEELWPRYGIDNEQDPLILDQVFGREAPVIVEIGFGDGAALAHAAERMPERNFLGIEVHRPGVGSMLQRIEQQSLTNVRILCADASRALDARVADETLAGIHLYFPDPWPKKRHHKRRIVQPAFVEMIHAKLEPGGYFHLATDWENYAEHMTEVVDAADRFEPAGESGPLIERPGWRPETKFERRGLKLGHGVWDLLYRKRDGGD